MDMSYHVIAYYSHRARMRAWNNQLADARHAADTVARMRAMFPVLFACPVQP
jgi:hypothetical protein